MAVGTHDIALGRLSEDAVQTCVPQHPGHLPSFRTRLLMVELHHEGQEFLPAIGAGSVAELRKHPGLRSPSGSPAFSLLRALDPLAPTSRAFGADRPDSMAVRTHHVAFGDLTAEVRLAGKHPATRAQPERLGGWIAMVEIHLMGLISAVAVGAGSST